VDLLQEYAQGRHPVRKARVWSRRLFPQHVLVRPCIELDAVRCGPGPIFLWGKRLVSTWFSGRTCETILTTEHHQFFVLMS
jgi:hypothetical protein